MHGINASCRGWFPQASTDMCSPPSPPPVRAARCMATVLYATTKAAILSMMECLYGELRDANADVHAAVVLSR